MKARDAVILWTKVDSKRETQGQVLVVKKPASSKTHDYRRDGGWRGWKRATAVQRRVLILLTFRDIVIRSGISPQDVHREFKKIDEYRALDPRDE